MDNPGLLVMREMAYRCERKGISLQERRLVAYLCDDSECVSHKKFERATFAGSSLLQIVINNVLIIE